MTKKEFTKACFNAGYEAKYSGRDKTYYLYPLVRVLPLDIEAVKQLKVNGIVKFV